MTKKVALLLLGSLAVCYAVIVVSFWNRGYLDFGDGNYIYISWRMAQGAVLYRDILAPQPPMHLYLGAVIARIGNALGSPLYTFRAFSLLLHMGTMALVYLVACRMTGGPDREERENARAAGLIAAAIYMVLPLGFWWTLGYQSEPLEMFFFMASLLAFLAALDDNQKSSSRAAASGILGAFPVLTNMTAAPYALFNIGFMAIRRPRLVLQFALPMLTIIASTVAFMELRTGAYLENVFFNQVGSFPRPEFLPPGETLWTYAVGKVIHEGGDVLHLEGGYVLIALAGLLLYSLRGPLKYREYASWYGFFSFCSILYVAKGGTEDYIFTIGEPMAAVFAGYLLFKAGGELLRRTENPKPFVRDFFRARAALVAAVIAVIVAAPGLMHSWATLNQRTYELGEHETMNIVNQIRSNSKPDELILAPPYYAFLAERRIAEDYSELFLWSLKYHNERQDRQHGRGVQTAQKIAELLKQKKIAYIVLDLGQTGHIPEIRAAIDENYIPLRQKEYQTLNTRLQFYKPRGT